MQGTVRGAHSVAVCFPSSFGLSKFLGMDQYLSVKSDVFVRVFL